MSSSNQNGDKSEETSNTPSSDEEERQPSDSSKSPKRSKRTSSSHKNKRGRKYKHKNTRKSKISRGFSRREKGSSCSDALPTVKRDKKPNGKLVPLQNSADKYQISPQASSEVPESITNTVTEDDVKLQIGREPVTQTQSKELESHNVERSQASDCQGHKDSDTGVPEDDRTEYGSIANSTILRK